MECLAIAAVILMHQTILIPALGFYASVSAIVLGLLLMWHAYRGISNLIGSLLP